MKLTLLLLALVAVTASVVYAAPQGDDDEEIAIQEFLEKAMQQSENNEEQEMRAQLQSLLAEMEEDGTIQENAAKKQFWAHAIRFAAPHVIRYVRKKWGR